MATSRPPSGAANVTMQLKQIKPQALRPDVIRMELLNALRAEGRATVAEHKKTVETWKNGKPTFEFLIGLNKDGAMVVCGPTGDTKGVNKWNWLNQGTRIRWAVMSRDWISKTRPNWVGSGRGQGRMLIAGRTAMIRRGIAPRPGIEARNWTKLIQDRRKDPFLRLLLAALQRGRAKLYSGGPGGLKE